METSSLAEELNHENKVKTVAVNISEDSMQAAIFLTDPGADNEYTPEELLEAIEQQGVKMGILEDVLTAAAQKKMYCQTIIVAQGKPKEEGNDGYYTYNFKTVLDKNPKILPDGSVDYLNAKLFEQVKEGDVIAVYTPPTKGQFGYDVRGRLLTPKVGKSLMTLRGRGFELSEDKTVYTANMTGKIEYRNGEIIISDVYEVKRDIDFSVGNINFDGEIHINGNVSSGISITAKGNIYVKGHVGGSVIKSDKDIILSDGVQAKETGLIEAKGSVSAKFFENANVRAGKDVRANYILNSDIYAENKVYVEGRRGTIVGGQVQGVMGIYTYNCGNPAFVMTVAKVGVTKQIRADYTAAVARLKELENEILQYTEVLDKMNRIKMNRPELFDSAGYTKVFQSKIIKSAEKSKLEEERKRLYDLIRESGSSAVYIDNIAYPGSKVYIENDVFDVYDQFKHVMIRRYNSEIIMRDYSE